MYSAKEKRWHQRRYQNRFNNGQCPNCGGARDSKWICCSICREKKRNQQHSLPLAKRNEIQKRYRDKCKRNRICYGCGSALGEDLHKRCSKCREADRLRHENSYRENILIGIT